MGEFSWIDVCEPTYDSLKKLADTYGLDYFQIVDSLQPGHLPKFEKLKDYSFLILRAYTGDPDTKITTIQEISNKMAIFYTNNTIISIHRTPFEFLDKVSDSYQRVDELLVYLIDQMIETYVEPAKILSDKVDKIEEIIFLKDQKKVSLEELYFQKAETRILKKLLLITQGVLQHVEVNEDSKIALQDTKDQLLHLILDFDEVLENSQSLLNTYLSLSSRKSNDVMKLLTIFSAFFLPLTFIVGIYGMNFDFMPELRWHYGYAACLIAMLTVSLSIFFWFKKEKIL